MCDCNVRDCLSCKIADPPTIGCNKISIVGAGHVGIACAICLLTKGITNEICLIDPDEKKVQGEILDLKHAASFLENAVITGGNDFLLTCNSRVIVITAGILGRADQPPLEMLADNAAIIKSIVPEVVKYSPRSILLIITNPVDVMTFYAWKLSGFPKNRVLGSGTTVDSARFRSYIAEKLGVGPNLVDAVIIGESGTNSVPVWSSVTVSGINLRDLNPCIGINEDVERFCDVHKCVIMGACNVIELKGYTNWAIALSCTSIVSAIFNNTGVALPVSTLVRGMYCIDKEVFLSLPCVLNVNGATSIIKLNLTKYEAEQFKNSADVIYEAQSKLDFSQK